MFAFDTHTPADLAYFEQVGIDPDSTQPRTRYVRCVVCGRPTWNQMGGCDNHYIGRAARHLRSVPG